jgi:hypothetical protein|tara:strand:- start:315877 stop:316611 length:735 start_codon:yes stop_codon:yes gene_type:complete
MFKRDKKHIFISCSPKSGSTYLLQLLATLLNYDIRIFIAAFDRTEQEVNEVAICDAKKINTVTHQHTRCTANNIRVLKKHKIKPLILTRNIYDSVISMRNHMHAEPQNSWWPMGYVDEDFYKLTPKQQCDFVIDLILPWYFNFYVSWFKHEKNTNKNLLWLTYEELMQDKLVTVNKILDYYNINITIKEQILLAAEAKVKGKTRKTVLPDNCPKVSLNEIQILKINSLSKYYPNVDFNKFGIVQ